MNEELPQELLDQDKKWMTHALSLAERAMELGEVPVGAVVVRDNDLVGQGFNQPIFSHDPSAHAEIVALRDASNRLENYRLPGTTLYITIEPCTMCFGAIVHARVERVVFGAPEPKSGVLVSNPLLLDSGVYNHEIQWTGGVLEEECSEVIQRFFKRRREEKKKVKASSVSKDEEN